MPEIYDATANPPWKQLTSSPLNQYYYPLDFVVPGGLQSGGRLVSVLTHGSQAFWLDLAGAGQTQTDPWRPLPSTEFTPSSGVMYRPGKILIAGGNSTEAVSGITKTFSMLTPGDTSNVWTSSSSMQPRFNHNLVILPTGAVLAVGGTGVFDNFANLEPVYRPQIWTPTAPNYATGTWTSPDTLGTDSLAANAAVRGYHSTAILLPDARVLCAGGNGTVGSCSPGPCDNSQLKAPPGDYMLFVVDGAGGNAVPSIARWVRLSVTAPPADTTAPDSAADFNVEFVAPHSIGLSWTAPGDNGNSGTASSYDVRRSNSPVNTDGAFNGAVQAQGEPAPDAPGSPQWFEVTGLASCIKYYFAMRTGDEACNASKLNQQQIWGKTICGGGGGGSSAHAVRSEGMAPSVGGAQDPPTGAAAVRHGVTPGPTSAITLAVSGDLTVETLRAADGGWRITVRIVSQAEGLAPGEEGDVIVQERTAEGSWRTRGSFHGSASDGVIALSSLHERGRVVLRGGFALQQVATSFSRGDGTYSLTSARSQLGALDPGLVATAVAGGDSVSLTYTPGSEGAATSEGWYLLAQKDPLANATRSRHETQEANASPTPFALHQNQPNPFSASTTIAFDLPRAVALDLVVYDLAGRRVQTLAQGPFTAGAHRVDWDRREAGGGRAPAGIYLYRLTAGEYRAERRLVLFP